MVAALQLQYNWRNGAEAACEDAAGGFLQPQQQRPAKLITPTAYHTPDSTVTQQGLTFMSRIWRCTVHQQQVYCTAKPLYRVKFRMAFNISESNSIAYIFKYVFLHLEMS